MTSTSSPAADSQSELIRRLVSVLVVALLAGTSLWILAPFLPAPLIGLLRGEGFASRHEAGRAGEPDPVKRIATFSMRRSAGAREQLPDGLAELGLERLRHRRSIDG